MLEWNWIDDKGPLGSRDLRALHILRKDKARIHKAIDPRFLLGSGYCSEGCRAARRPTCRGSCRTCHLAFAFDQTRSAIVLCGGDKEDVEQKKFYKSLIKQADARFSAHIGKTKEKKA